MAFSLPGVFENREIQPKMQLVNIAYVFTIGWMVMTFGVLFWLVKYRDSNIMKGSKRNSKRRNELQKSRLYGEVKILIPSELQAK